MAVERLPAAADPLWDRLVDRFGGGFYDASGWQGAVAETFGNLSCHRFVAREQAAINGGLALFETRSLLTGHRLTTSPFHLAGRPLASEAGTVQALAAAALDFGRRRGVRSVEIDCGDQWAADLFETLGFVARRPFLRPHVPLGRAYDAVFAGYRPQFRTNLRRWRQEARRCGLAFAVLDPRRDESAFHRLVARQFRDKHCNLPAPRRFLRQLRRKDRGAVRLYALRHGKDLTAATMLLLHGPWAHYAWSAMDERWQRQAVSAVLLDRVVADLCRPPYRIRWLDLGPVSVQDEGLGFFKSRWGGQTHRPALWVRSLRGPARPVLDGGAAPCPLRRLVRYLPLPIFDLLGRTLYGQLA